MLTNLKDDGNISAEHWSVLSYYSRYLDSLDKTVKGMERQIFKEKEKMQVEKDPSSSVTSVTGTQLLHRHVVVKSYFT